MIKKIAATMFLIGLIVFSVTVKANAHVFFTDDTGSSGVILHVLPDDDPIAGQPTNLFFDIQDKNLNTEKYDYTLVVTDEKNIQTQAITDAVGPNSIAVTYIFPSQGIFSLKLAALPSNAPSNSSQDPVTFSYSQRVTRGASGSPLDQKRYAWAEFGLMLGICALILLVILAISQRTRIKLNIKQL